MNDPFTVLGISSSATEDEIKAAYRKLAKKYHPDLNPGDAAAEKKMREVNEAYTHALQIRKGGGASSYRGSYGSSSGTSGTGYSGNPFGYGRQDPGDPWHTRYAERENSSGNPFGSYGFDPFAAFFGGASPHRDSAFRDRNYRHPDMHKAASLIRNRQYAEALQLLNRIPLHDADWHALYARADLGMGNRISALDHARSAASMSPGDAEYQQLLSIVLPELDPLFLPNADSLLFF